MESLAESMPGQAAMPRFEDGSVNLMELIRRLAEDVVNAIMDAEAAQLCSGGANSRNGYRELNLVTCVGDITMRIPKLRSGSFFPEDVVERYQRVASTTVVTAIGCDEGGWRRVLGLSMVNTESYDSWLEFLRRIKGRGVQPVTSDAHKGPVNAVEEVFQGASWQRCAVHLMCDCKREAGSRQLKKRVGRITSPAFRAKDAATARAMYHVACDMLRECCPKAADVAEEAEPDALAYLAFPPSHWKRLRTNNVQERADREIKRHSRVVQVFPSERSPERLVGAVMCEQDEQWSASRYFAYDKMQELYDERRKKEPEAPGRPAADLAEAARKIILASLELAEKVDAA